MIDNVDDGWHTYVTEEKEKAIATIISDESLKDAEARRFILNAFRDGFIKTTGSDIDKILPPVSRFSGSNRKEKRQAVIEKLMTFFEEFFGIA
jgi:type I restriction enzyme R subunit